MHLKTIGNLPKVEELLDDDYVLVEQAEKTKSISAKNIKAYMAKEVYEYVDQKLSGKMEWLPPVNFYSELRFNIDPSINYLCKVVEGDEEHEAGTYQAVEGWETSPEWMLFDNNVDFVNERELAAAIFTEKTALVEEINNEINKKISLNEKGAVNGVATLGSEGKVPLEQLPEVLTGGYHAVIETLYPIGSLYKQRFCDFSPVENGLSGTWVIWNHRASGYRLIPNSIPDYTIYQQGANYAINSVVMYHLEGDDWAFFRANRAITNAAEQLDPVMWDQLKTGVVVERKYLLDVNPWEDDDFEIGQQIVGGEYDGYYVEEIIVYGGKFFSVAGGNRPTSKDGIQGDAIRNIQGLSGLLANLGSVSSGAFLESAIENVDYTYYFSNGRSYRLILDPSRVVPIDNENQVRNLSVIIWRRIN